MSHRTAAFAMAAGLACLVPMRALAADPPKGAKAASPATGPALDTEDKKTLYALGLVVSRNLGQFALTAGEIDIVVAAMKDGLSGAKPQVELDTYGPKIQALAQARAAVAAAAEGKESDAHLAKMAAEKGAKKEASGLVYTEMKAGTGASPKPTDNVKVHYHGTLRDGTVFDSSVKRGEPAEFVLNQVIPCWTEALQKMKVGGKSKITCPAAIAYGERGTPDGTIKPGAALTFEVELLSIGPAPAPAPATGAAPAPSH